MKLNKDVFKQGVQDLLDFYPSWGLDASSARVMNKWYKEFEDISDTEFSSAIKNHINNERFNPTVAALKDPKNKQDTMYSTMRRV